MNAASGIRVIGPRNEGSKKVVPPSKDDMSAMLEAAEADIRFMILFSASTRVRAGEQWALRWRDIDFHGRELNIRTRVDSYGEEGPPKSAAGIRDVPLSVMLLRLLKKW